MIRVGVAYTINHPAGDRGREAGTMRRALVEITLVVLALLGLAGAAAASTDGHRHTSSTCGH